MRIVEPDHIIDLESLSPDMSVMKALGFLFVDIDVLVRVVP